VSLRSFSPAERILYSFFVVFFVRYAEDEKKIRARRLGCLGAEREKQIYLTDG
jgi:hypothetical protein